MQKYILTVIIFLFLSQAPAQAQGKITESSSASHDVYQTIYDTPSPLREVLVSNSITNTQEAIQHVQHIISYGRNPNALDAEDIRNAKEKYTDRKRRQQVQNLIEYDQNLDGVLTRDEIRKHLIKKNFYEDDNDKLEGRVNSLMKLDTNKDAKISIQEAGILEKETIAYENTTILESETLLNADPNQDGTLTLAELKILALKAFYTIDINNDGILTKEERADLKNLNEAARWMPDNLSKCGIPSANKDENIIFLGTYKGETIATASVAERLETFIAPITLESNNDKIYLIVSSWSPIIWQLKGDTSKISRISVVGPSLIDDAGYEYADIENKINAGVVGVDRSKVTFHNLDKCGLRNVHEGKSETENITKNAFEKILGREPDDFKTSRKILTANIQENKISLDDDLTSLPPDQKTPPELLLQGKVPIAPVFNPGGVIKIDPAEIISDYPSSTYKVLPGWEGIAQLINSGAIVPNSDETYKIIKDIPHYPAALTGGKRIKFIIAKGVNVPKGDPGHSCVMLEETREPVANSSCQ